MAGCVRPAANSSSPDRSARATRGEPGETSTVPRLSTWRPSRHSTPPPARVSSRPARSCHWTRPKIRAGVVEMDVDVGVDDRRLGDAVARRLPRDADVGPVGDDATGALADDADVLVARAERVRGVERGVGLARPAEVAQDAALQRQDVGAVRLQRLGVLHRRVGVVDPPAGEQRGPERDARVDLSRRTGDDVAQERDGFGAAADAREQPAEPDPRVEVVGVGVGERLERLDRAQRVARSRHPLGVLVGHARTLGRLRAGRVTDGSAASPGAAVVASSAAHSAATITAGAAPAAR